jgi:hypothetical protein
VLGSGVFGRLIMSGVIIVSLNNPFIIFVGFGSEFVGISEYASYKSYSIASSLIIDIFENRVPSINIFSL